MGLIERVETRTDNVERHADEHGHDAVHQDASTCALFVLRRDVTLYDGLVRRVRDEIVGQPTKDDYPEGGTGEVEGIVEEAELIVSDGYFEET